MNLDGLECKSCDTWFVDAVALNDHICENGPACTLCASGFRDDQEALAHVCHVPNGETFDSVFLGNLGVAMPRTPFFEDV